MSALGAPPTPSLLIDTNVVLDVVLARAPWDKDATLLLDAIARGDATGFVSSHAVTTVYYLVNKAKSAVVARTAVSDLLDVVDVVALDGNDFRRALAMGLDDYEDAAQAAACLKVGASYLATRNAKDFKGAPVQVHSPTEILAILAATR